MRGIHKASAQLPIPQEALVKRPTMLLVGACSEEGPTRALAVCLFADGPCTRLRSSSLVSFSLLTVFYTFGLDQL